MESVTKEQMEDIKKIIEDIKMLIAKKGSKEEAVRHFMQETGLPQEECEQAFEFYNNVKLP